MENQAVPWPEFDGTQACATEPTDLFFPHESEDGAPAKAICQVCPFRRPCLAFALTRQVSGVWGGTTEAERRSLRRRHGIGTVPFPGPERVFAAATDQAPEGTEP